MNIVPTSSWTAAGVLPYCYDSDSQGVPRIRFLLGKELDAKHNTYFWSDFGGRSEPEDISAEQTAAREFAEETLGIIGGEGMHLQTRISQSAAKVNKVLADQNPESMVVTIRGPKYTMFMMQLAQQPDPLILQIARDENDINTLQKSSGEKRDFVWIEGRRLLQCAIFSQSRGRLQYDPPRDEYGGEIKLLPGFARNLRLCLEQALDAICASLKVRGAVAETKAVDDGKAAAAESEAAAEEETVDGCEGAAAEGCKNRMLLTPSEKTRCLHIAKLVQTNLQTVRAALEQYGVLESLVVCAGKNYGFGTFLLQDAAANACKQWPQNGVTGVRLGFARRDNPIQGAPKARIGRDARKVRRKRRKLGVGEPIATESHRRNVASQSPRNMRNTPTNSTNNVENIASPEKDN